MDWTLTANLLVLLANLAILGITVKLYTEILKDRKFDVREVRSGPSTPGTPGTLRTTRTGPAINSTDPGAGTPA